MSWKIYAGMACYGYAGYLAGTGSWWGFAWVVFGTLLIYKAQNA